LPVCCVRGSFCLCRFTAFWFCVPKFCRFGLHRTHYTAAFRLRSTILPPSPRTVTTRIACWIAPPRIYTVYACTVVLDVPYALLHAAVPPAFGYRAVLPVRYLAHVHGSRGSRRFVGARGSTHFFARTVCVRIPAHFLPLRTRFGLFHAILPLPCRLPQVHGLFATGLVTPFATPFTHCTPHAYHSARARTAHVYTPLHARLPLPPAFPTPHAHTTHTPRLVGAARTPPFHTMVGFVNVWVGVYVAVLFSGSALRCYAYRGPTDCRTLHWTTHHALLPAFYPGCTPQFLHYFGFPWFPTAPQLRCCTTLPHMPVCSAVPTLRSIAGTRFTHTVTRLPDYATFTDLVATPHALRLYLHPLPCPIHPCPLYHSHCGTLCQLPASSYRLPTFTLHPVVGSVVFVTTFPVPICRLHPLPLFTVRVALVHYRFYTYITFTHTTHLWIGFWLQDCRVGHLWFGPHYTFGTCHHLYPILYALFTHTHPHTRSVPHGWTGLYVAHTVPIDLLIYVGPHTLHTGWLDSHPITDHTPVRSTPAFSSHVVCYTHVPTGLFWTTTGCRYTRGLDHITRLHRYLHVRIYDFVGLHLLPVTHRSTYLVPVARLTFARSPPVYTGYPHFAHTVHVCPLRRCLLRSPLRLFTCCTFPR